MSNISMSYPVPSMRPLIFNHWSAEMGSSTQCLIQSIDGSQMDQSTQTVDPKMVFQNPYFSAEANPSRAVLSKDEMTEDPTPVKSVGGKVGDPLTGADDAH